MGIQWGAAPVVRCGGNAITKENHWERGPMNQRRRDKPKEIRGSPVERMMLDN